MEDFLKEKETVDKKPIFDLKDRTYILWFFCVMLIVASIFNSTLYLVKKNKDSKVEMDSVKNAVNKIDSSILFYPIKK